MAVDVDTDDAGAPPAHGRAIAGDGKSKGRGPAWLSGPHRDEILVVSSVVLVLFGWLSLRKTGSNAAGMSADGSTSAAQAAYLGNSGSVAGFDQAAVQGLQDSLAQQRDSAAGAFEGLQQLLANQQATIDRLVPTVSTVPSSQVPPATPTAGALLHPSVLSRPGDSLPSIANYFYGNPDAMRIFNANRATLGNDPNAPLTPGTYLAIPN